MNDEHTPVGCDRRAHRRAGSNSILSASCDETGNTRGLEGHTHTHIHTHTHAHIHTHAHTHTQGIKGGTERENADRGTRREGEKKRWMDGGRQGRKGGRGGEGSESRSQTLDFFCKQLWLLSLRVCVCVHVLVRAYVPAYCAGVRLCISVCMCVFVCVPVAI